MRKIWNSIKSFWQEEDGASFLELAIIIIIMIGIAIAVYALAQSVTGKVEEAKSMVEGFTFSSNNP